MGRERRQGERVGEAGSIWVGRRENVTKKRSVKEY